MKPMRMFDTLMWPAGSETLWAAATHPIHATEDAKGATIVVDMPGVSPEDLDVTYDNGKLAIEGKRGARVYRYGITLGSKFDPSSIDAKLDKGVLTLTANVKAEAQPRKIAVSGQRKTLDTNG